METKRKSFLARATMTLSGARRVATMLLVTLLLTMTAQTAWADTWPEYISEVKVLGASASNITALKTQYENAGWTIIDFELNDGAGGDWIYLAYKTASRNSTNGGYITDFYISNHKGVSSLPSSVSYDGKTYYLCDYDGDSYFCGLKGDLNSNAGGDDIHLYYTKANFSDKRVVSNIYFNTTQSGAVKKNGNEGDGYDLNTGCGSNTTDIYMHLTTPTKTNRPSSDPVMASGLVYDGSAKQLITTAATLASGTMYYRIGTSGEWKTSISELTATDIGIYTVQYKVGANDYATESGIQSKTVKILSDANDSWKVGNGADGTSAHPFLISTKEGLDLLASTVNNSSATLVFRDKYFKLTSDITYSYAGLSETQSNYTPIGNDDKHFCGHFDGNGHTISGIRIYMNHTHSAIGLFGWIDGAEIHDLTLTDTRITGQYTVGGIAGISRNGNTISNCHVTGTVTLLAYYNNASDFGGIVGDNDGTISGCTSAATVSNNGYSGCERFGSIVGYHYTYYDSIENCLVVGGSVNGSSFVGAIIGKSCYADPHLTNNYHTLYGIGAVEGADKNGAKFSLVSSTKPAGFGNVTQTYGTGSYTGIKVYGTNGLEYRGKYYCDANLLTLSENASNASAISGSSSQTRNVVLDGRTLYKDGKWNTLCLPFDVTIASSPLSGDNVQAMTLNNSTSALSGSTLTLNFTTATNTTIPAGTPFIIKWDGDGSNNLVNPIFTGVTISNANRDVTSTDGKVSFKGTYAYQAFGSEDKSILLVGGSNLYWPQNGARLGACRAYFELSDGASASEFVLNFGDETTGIRPNRPSPDPSLNNGGEWYDLSGRKLTQKPTQKGVYIVNGKKVVVK